MGGATGGETVLVVGLGHVGLRFAEVLRARGVPVAGTVRSPGRVPALTQQGIDVTILGLPGPVPAGLCPPGAAVVLSAPPSGPDPRTDAGTRALLEAIRPARPRALVYLSTTSVYAERDGGEVTEESPVDDGPDRAAARLDAERAVLEAASEMGGTGIVFRLAAIYGRGRGLAERVRAGRVLLWGGGENLLNRIHVDDIVAFLERAVDAPPERSGVYDLADDRPASLREVSVFLADRLGVPRPAPAPAADAPSPTLLGSKRVSNAKAKAAFGLELRYPSYVEGFEGP